MGIVREASRVIMRIQGLYLQICLQSTLDGKCLALFIVKATKYSIPQQTRKVKCTFKCVCVCACACVRAGTHARVCVKSREMKIQLAILFGALIYY